MIDAVAMNMVAARTVGPRMAAEKRGAAMPAPTRANQMKGKARSTQAAVKPTWIKVQMAPKTGAKAPRATGLHRMSGKMMTVVLASQPTVRTMRKCGRPLSSTARRGHRRLKVKLTLFERKCACGRWHGGMAHGPSHLSLMVKSVQGPGSDTPGEGAASKADAHGPAAGINDGRGSRAMTMVVKK